MCACTEPVRTDIGAVYVECGRPKWPITMLNHTYRIMFCFLFLAPYARTTRYEQFFFPWKTKKKKARFARAPHDNEFVASVDRKESHGTPLPYTWYDTTKRVI